MTELLEHLRARREGGRKLLVPYLMGGIPEPEAYPDALRAVAQHADTVEVGLPYSDPLMDGPVIAAAGERALRAGVGPIDTLRATTEVELAVPRVAMTYYNPIHKMGEAEFCTLMVGAGFVYAVSTLGVTGERGSLSERAAKVVAACRVATDLPVLVGIGVSTPQHALEATAEADGVVIGSAVVRLVLEQGAAAASTFLGTIRDALDAV